MRKIGRLILWQRAQDYLQRHQPTLIGVGGSTGKTITKQAIALALGKERHVRTSPHSYSAPIGIVLTILGVTSKDIATNWFRALTSSKAKEIARAEPDTIVVELGSNRPGVVDFLARRLRFNIAVITNVHSANLHLFSNKETVSHEIMSMIVDLSRDNTAVLNADDPLVAAMQEKMSGRVILYGISPQAHVKISRLERVNTHGFACQVTVEGKSYELHLPNLVAPYHVPHAVAALATAHAAGANLKKAAQQLQQLQPPPSRMRHLHGVNKSQLLDDSYNATPEDTAAALELLGNLPATRRIAILGDIKNLGTTTIRAHQAIGNQAARVADILIIIGDQMKHAGQAALKSASNVDIHTYQDSRDVGKWLRQYLKEGDLVLIKGSREMRMEYVTHTLLANPNVDETNVLPLN